MGKSEADDFLNCVMKRTESDSLFRVGLVLAITILSLFVTIFVLYTAYGDIVSDLILGFSLLSWSVTFYVLYLEIRGINLHRRRDAEWMAALAAYARSRGRGTDEMDAFPESSGSTDYGRSMTASKLTFLSMFAFNVFLAMWVRTLKLDAELENDILSMAPLLLVLEISGTAVYIYRTILDHDSVQSRFTSLFADNMGEELGIAGPLNTGLRGSRVWPHVLAIIITLGLYSTFYNLVAVRKMNIHLTAQWAYEENLITAIAKAEGASGIRKNETKDQSTIRTLIDIATRRARPGRQI